MTDSKEEVVEEERRQRKIDFRYSIYSKSPPVLWGVGGPRGSGKSSACRSLEEYLTQTISISRFLTDKTRAKRTGETEGDDANFISNEEYKRRKGRGEYAVHFDDLGGHGYSKAGIERGLQNGHLIVQIGNADALLEMSRKYPQAVPIMFIADKTNLVKAITERPVMYSEDEQREIIASIPAGIEGFSGIADYVRYIIFKASQSYETSDLGRLRGIDTTIDHLLRIMEREIWLREHLGVYEQCLTPDENNRNFIEFLTRKIVRGFSFEELQQHLKQKGVFEVGYDDIGQDFIDRFVYERGRSQSHISQETLKHHFPLRIIAAIDAHGRRSIILDSCGGEDFGKARRELVREFLTYLMDTYHDFRPDAVTTPDIISYSGLVELVNRTEGRNIKIYDGPVFYLTHHLGQLGDESLRLHIPYALNIAFADIGYDRIREGSLEIVPQPLDALTIRRFKEDLENKAVINQRLGGEYTKRDKVNIEVPF